MEPVERVRQQEVPHFVAPVVEDQRAPVAVLALAGIRVLVERGPVEPGQRVGILGKVAGNPVEDHADAVAVTRVDERAEIVRRSEAAGRRVEPGDLITPRSREGVLHDRQQLDVRVAHLLDVRDETLGELAVGQEAMTLLGRPRPGPEMDLIDRHRPGEPSCGLRAVPHPVVIVPRMFGSGDHRRGQRWHLECGRIGIDLEDDLAVPGTQLELVAMADMRGRDEDLPHAARAQ